MSRSSKKTPKTGITTAETEKGSKRKANRKLRRVTKMQVKKGDIDLVKIKEISNVWAFDKDGKQFLKTPTKNIDKWDNGTVPDSEIDVLGFSKYDLPYNSDLVSGQYPTTSIFGNNLPVNWNISLSERQQIYKLYYPRSAYNMIS